MAIRHSANPYGVLSGVLSSETLLFLLPWLCCGCCYFFFNSTGTLADSPAFTVTGISMAPVSSWATTIV
jgi:hypothetical protein